MGKILELENLNIGYTQAGHRKEVASDLCASLMKGEMTCLLGANGKGKSTLMKTICGFLKPLNGSLQFNGRDITRMTEREMAKEIAIVLTEKISTPNATVFELVAYGRSPFTGFLGRLSAKDKQIVDEAIFACGIQHKKYSPLAALSDGERQKATIAKALAQDTPLILLDEPTAFLDLPARVEIMQLLRKLASEKGKSILMSTHDLDLALQMSDRLWLLHHDQIVAGSPEDLTLINAFQSMFNKGGVEFDNKTGMFKVLYNHESLLPVHGHGFEYVLLRRAFARKGIKLIQGKQNEAVWINIMNNSTRPYVLMNGEDVSEDFASIEETVKRVIQQLSQTSSVKFEVNEITSN
ncbi:ABC transporter ATP-binding protein [Carboxylicivirga sp. N1Y90]|uniref:ABC transporter ATP-binding protein n=1 Tax=Carboxylicivirga fragile TaxID=3417571 RepID=UPI003D3517B9|nr:ABC transporter ATP-binding protein [Marinilabiliaceae bacterium N1Y90]